MKVLQTVRDCEIEMDRISRVILSLVEKMIEIKRDANIGVYVDKDITDRMQKDVDRLRLQLEAVKTKHGVLTSGVRVSHKVLTKVDGKIVTLFSNYHRKEIDKLYTQAKQGNENPVWIHKEIAKG